MVSPAIHFEAHWLDGRSYICPGDDCLACTAFVHSKIVAALTFTSKDRPLQLVKTPASQWHAEIGTEAIGQIVDVQLDGRKIVVKSETRKQVYKPTHELEVWAALATLHRLPLPFGVETQEAIEELNKAAEKQILLALPILAQYGYRDDE